MGDWYSQLQVQKRGKNDINRLHPPCAHVVEPKAKAYRPILILNMQSYYCVFFRDADRLLQ